ncbi:MAG: tRNA-dihydrouridine synthase, partial [Spirochaetota bacterium]
MIDRTEPRFRYFIRQLFPEISLYTEMISSGAIIHGPRARFLSLLPCEPPIALQIGTHCPEEAYQAVTLAREFCDRQNCHFTEYNLNAGCPSDRVQNRNIGAILMNDAPLVADILAAMRQALRDSQNSADTLPQVTLKHRLGIQGRGIEMTGAEPLYSFLRQVAPYTDRLIIHARIAILEGLDPKQNREIPPLNYPLVFAIRQMLDRPIELNGGLRNFAQIAEAWPHVDGVMLGRVSYEDTWELFRIRRQVLANGWLTARNSGVRNRSELAGLYADYLEQHPGSQSMSAQIWPLLMLWHGLPEARHWRRMLSPPYS